MKNLTHTKIINEIIENVRDDMRDEEIIHLVLEKTVALPDGKDETLGQKIADKIAHLGGSWTFIIIFIDFRLLPYPASSSHRFLYKSLGTGQYAPVCLLRLRFRRRLRLLVRYL